MMGRVPPAGQLLCPEGGRFVLSGRSRPMAALRSMETGWPAAALRKQGGLHSTGAFCIHCCWLPPCPQAADNIHLGKGFYW